MDWVEVERTAKGAEGGRGRVVKSIPVGVDMQMQMSCAAKPRLFTLQVRGAVTLHSVLSQSHGRLRIPFILSIQFLINQDLVQKMSLTDAATVFRRICIRTA